MAATPRAITLETLGAWLIKANPAVYPAHDLVGPGLAAVTSRCVKPTYRTDLINVGQPVLLWISGQDPGVPAGLYGQGRTTGPTESSIDDDRWMDEAEAGQAAELIMPIELAPIAPPVLRSEILAHPPLSGIEVVRMAAGSNPSFITREHLRELKSQWPQVTVA